MQVRLFYVEDAPASSEIVKDKDPNSMEEYETHLSPQDHHHVHHLHLDMHELEKKLHETTQKLYHYTHVAAHCAYFIAVYVEGHGFYAFMGGALFIITIAGLLSGSAE